MPKNVFSAILNNNTVDEKEKLRELASASSALLDYEIEQKKTLRKMAKVLSYSTSERQKRYIKQKKESGYKQIHPWVRNDPKYKYAGADIHVENIGICKKDNKVLIAMEAFMGYLKSEGISPELLEDITELLRVFGFGGVGIDFTKQKPGAPDIPEAS